MIYGSTGRRALRSTHGSLANPPFTGVLTRIEILYSSGNARNIIIVYSRTIPSINVKGGIAKHVGEPWVPYLSSPYFLSTILCNYVVHIFRNIVVLDILEW